jgi:ATP-dependent RNA helicase MSS116
LEIIRHHTEKADPSTPFKAIVFLPTTASVTYYSHLFRHLRGDEPWMPKIFEMHSRLSQSTRTHNADAFRKATSAILISSDVSARGMDFPNVTHVIQVHVPTTRDTYIHRIGRTGRAGKEGQAYLLVSDIEVPSARYLLPGLPIQRCTDFESGLVDVRRAHRLPDTFEKIREAAKKVPHEVLKETYTSLLLGNMSSVEKQEMVDELNNMAKYTWGMEAPPAVSPKLKRHLGRVRGLRIADEPRFRHSRGRGFRGGFDRDYNDRFENLERMAAEERDGHKPSRVPRASF